MKCNKGVMYWKYDSWKERQKQDTYDRTTTESVQPRQTWCKFYASHTKSHKSHSYLNNQHKQLLLFTIQLCWHVDKTSVGVKNERQNHWKSNKNRFCYSAILLFMSITYFTESLANEFKNKSTPRMWCNSLMTNLR